MLSNQKIFRLKSLRVSSALSGAMVFGLLSLTPISHSCGGKSKTKSSQTSAPSGDVEVTATVNTEEDPTEFKEADEAIMIGGVNLEVSKQHQIKVYGITSTGEQLISSTESASPTFKITIPARTYTIITVTSADGVRKAVLPGNYGPLAKAVININRVTGVAAEIVRIAGKKALQGNADAKDIIANNRIPMAALHTLASNAVEVIRIQKEKNQPATAIDLTAVSLEWVKVANTEAKKAISSGQISADEYSQTLSKSAFEQLLTNAATVTTYFRGNDSMVAGQSKFVPVDITYISLENLRANSTIAVYAPEMMAFHQDGDINLRRPPLATAQANQTTIHAIKSATYDQCQAQPSACGAIGYIPSQPPGDVGAGGTTSGGTTSGGTTGTSANVAPGSFTISSATNGDSQSIVTWGASAGASSYTLKYGTSSGTYANTFSTSATSPATITGLINGTTYYFMVTAVNSTGSTNATAEVSATPAGATSTTFTSGSGTFTVPAGVTLLTIEVWGGGGAGGHGYDGGSSSSGSGGGGGGYTIKSNLAVTSGQTFSYTVGAGGAATAFSAGCLAGSNGGNSYVDSSYFANGGVGGDSCGNGTGGQGGTASGGTINTSGTSGASGSVAAGAGGAGANGGAGGAGDSVSDGLNTNVGTAPGGGGGGGKKNIGSGDPGAAGGSGQVKFSW